jgi:UDP:flavonoid glycosyltransferase YjiC (YdhE family)
MARIVVSATGTLGDILPLVELAVGLQRRGHHIRLAVNPAMRDVVSPAGLYVVPCGVAFGSVEAVCARSAGEERFLSGMDSLKTEARVAGTPEQHRDLMETCRDADLLISHSFQCAARLVHDCTRLPWVCVSLVPAQYAHCGFPAFLPSAPRATLNLLASSGQFCLPDLILYDDLHLTGFLFFDGRRLLDWEPDAELRTFVESGERVLLLALGCLPGPWASRVVEAAVAAATLLKRKLVIQCGWADQEAMSEAVDGEQVRLTGALPHDWLLEHADAVIHGGGTGLCARALRAGKPMVVLPQRLDQIFNARVVLALGAGAALSPSRLTGSALAGVLEAKVLTAPYFDAAQEMGEVLDREDGLTTACERIEGLVK